MAEHNLNVGSVAAVDTVRVDSLRSQADTAALGETARSRYEALWASTMVPGLGNFDEDEDDAGPAGQVAGDAETLAMPAGSGWLSATATGGRVEFLGADGVRLVALAPQEGAWRAFVADPASVPVSSLGLVALEGGSRHADFAGSPSYQEATFVVNASGPVAVVLGADGALVRVPLASHREWEAIEVGGPSGARVAAAAAGREILVVDGVAMQPMAAAGLARAGYDASGRRLVVEGHDGRITVHGDVAPEKWAALRDAPSHQGHYGQEFGRDAGGDRPPSGHCPACGRFAGDGHECPVPYAAGEVRLDGRSEDLVEARWSDGAATVCTSAGERLWVADVSAEEFNRLAVDPDVTFRAWEAGRRLSGPTREGPVAEVARVPAGLESAPLVAHPIEAGTARLPALRGVRAAAARAGGETIHVPVSAEVRSGEGRVTVSGFLSVRQAPGGLAVASDRGMLAGGSPAQRRRLAEEVTARLRSCRSRGAPAVTRRVQREATGRLAGFAEASRAAQARAAGQWSPGSAWAQDPALFDRHVTAARERKARGEPGVPYMRENALGGLGDREGGRGFGVEIEFDLDPSCDAQATRAAILRDLRAEGVIPPDRHPDTWLSRDAPLERGYRTWACVDDDTVSGEIVSPVLYDEPEAWEQLEKVCKVLRRHGAVATTRAGCHVHVGCADYDHSVDNHRRLLSDFAAYADPLYRLATDPGRGEHRGVDWCAPNQALPPGYRSVAEVQAGQSDRSFGLNFRSVGGNSADHVENRTGDASLDPAVIQTQIKVSVALVAASFAGRNAGAGETEPLGSHAAAGDEDGASSTIGTRRMLDRLFCREEDKAQAAALFGVTTWARPRRRHPLPAHHQGSGGGAAGPYSAIPSH